ncbi:MAG TPA: GlsB/YeaQ/YmgE family stress response membrane protein [Thermomicrobiales bacterium]|nr:GlsB/YeaQ/YmgE family stress response membrane protein [Thermomicrobiales bacterium]
MVGLLTWIVVGVAAGWLAGVITRTDRGILGDLVLGIVGAVVAGWVTDLSVGDDGLIWTILVAAVFAAVLVFVKGLLLDRG